MIVGLFTLVAALMATYYLIPLCMSAAYKLNILDVPNKTIKNHEHPIPYLGGLAVFGGFLIALALFLPLNNQFFVFFIGTLLALFLGLLDDLLSLSPLQKLLGQCIIALTFIKGGFYVKDLFFQSHIYLLNILLRGFSLVWILALTNAFNLIDVMDGLATTVAISSAIGFLSVAIAYAELDVALVLCALIGALVPFLMVNKPAARMYLGDTGSLFLGGFFSVMPFMIHWGKVNSYYVFASVAFLFIPLMELVFLVLIRSYKGIPFYRGSHDHFSHILQREGLSKPAILIATAMLSSILNIIGYFYALGQLSPVGFMSILCVLGLAWVIFLGFLDQRSLLLSLLKIPRKQ